MPDQSCSCCKALWVKFYLTADLTTAMPSAAAKVLVVGGERQFWQGEDPDPLTPEVGFPVYNLEENALTPGVYKFSGKPYDVGLACLDESLPNEDRYRIVTLNVDDDLVHFELTADLTLGSSATAKVLVWNGTTWAATGATITVYDWYTQPGMWQAYSGYRGLAIHSRESQRHEIVWMETRARSIEFTLTANMSSGSASASISGGNYYLQGKDPGGQTGTLTVYDALGNYPYALTGAKGKARWNDRDRRYEIVECNQRTFAILCNLSAPMCTGTPQGTFNTLLSKTLCYPPYGQDPAPFPATADNIFGLAGKSGDYCLVVWDEYFKRWIIAQVQHHEKTFITDIRYRSSQGSCSIQIKDQKTAVMVCEEESDWKDKIPLYDNEYVDEVRFTGCDTGSGSGSGQGGSMKIEYHTSKVCMLEAPKPQSWHEVLTFQEQYVLTAIYGSGNCIVGGGLLIATPCVGDFVAGIPICATAQTTCTCTCDCGSGSGSGNCTCSCQCQTVVYFA